MFHSFSECGKFVHKVGFAFYKIGARKLDLLISSLRRPFFPLMLVIFLACVSSMFFRSTRLPFVPVLPTSWLITLASMDDRPYPIWTELLTRTWTPEQSRDLSLKLKAVMENYRSTRSYLLAGHPAYMSFQSGNWPAPLSSSEIGELIGSDELFQLHALEPGAPGTPRAFQIGCTSAQPILGDPCRPPRLCCSSLTTPTDMVATLMATTSVLRPHSLLEKREVLGPGQIQPF